MQAASQEAIKSPTNARKLERHLMNPSIHPFPSIIPPDHTYHHVHRIEGVSASPRVIEYFRVRPPSKLSPVQAKRTENYLLASAATYLTDQPTYQPIKVCRDALASPYFTYPSQTSTLTLRGVRGVGR